MTRNVHSRLNFSSPTNHKLQNVHKYIHSRQELLEAGGRARLTNGGVAKKFEAPEG